MENNGLMVHTCGASTQIIMVFNRAVIHSYKAVTVCEACCVTIYETMGLAMASGQTKC